LADVTNGSAPSQALTQASTVLAETRDIDACSQAWIQRLTSGRRERDAAVRELHSLLLRAARFTLARRGASLRELRERLDDLALEAADDALVAVLAHLDDYRGDSRFTTWAWKFAIVQTSVAIRRRSWTAREIPIEDEAWATLSESRSLETGLEDRELLQALRQSFERELTPYQRRVFVALAPNEVPVDVLAQRLETTRGALYKTLHDARHKLRSHLAASGLGPEQWSSALVKPADGAS
jgi:RNA polymerase sigma-70 factor (ECF subfamily)